MMKISICLMFVSIILTNQSYGMNNESAHDEYQYNNIGTSSIPPKSHTNADEYPTHKNSVQLEDLNQHQEEFTQKNIPFSTRCLGHAGKIGTIAGFTLLGGLGGFGYLSTEVGASLAWQLTRYATPIFIGGMIGGTIGCGAGNIVRNKITKLN